MKPAVLLLVALLSAAASPATRPTSAPSATHPAAVILSWQDLPEYSDLAARLKAAESALAAAQAADDKSLAADPELARLTTSARDAAAEADRLRAQDAPIQQRLDAGSKATAARKAAEARRASLISADRPLSDARGMRIAMEPEIDAARRTYDQRVLAEHHARDLAARDRSLPIRRAPLKVGMIGRLQYVVIHQVVDKSNAVARIEYEDDSHRDVWLAGLDTSGKVDDHHYTIEGVWKVTGTKTYTTVLGTRTLFVLEPDDR